MNMKIHKLLLTSAMAVGLAAGGSVAAADDTMSQNVTEARQESQIWTTYVLNSYLRASDLKVSVHAGKATLTGKVEESVSKDLAEQIALGVDGIREVDNQIKVDADYKPVARAERSFGDVVDDASITSAVKSKLLWSRKTDGLTTDVDTKRGKVTLTGSADSDAEKSLAERLAANTKGVVSVSNQLVVKESSKQGSVANAKQNAKGTKGAVADGWITTKVKSTFAYSSNVDGMDISVSTEKGIVTLSGEVGSGAERALAIELAENVRGVKSVQAKGLTISNVVANR